MEDQATQRREQAQAATKPRDIPDATSKKADKPPMAPGVQIERNARRYIRKDGVFIKDVEYLWRRNTGRYDAKGNPIFELEKTREEAEQLVTELLEQSGRKVAPDPISGRLKATPGWDLNIRVPGFEQSEQSAPKEPEGKLRERLNDQMLLEMREERTELLNTVAELKKTVEKLAGGPVKDTKDMNVLELRKYAKDNEIDLGAAKTKPDMLAAIDKARAERTEDEG